jgi:hypothetical protein
MNRSNHNVCLYLCVHIFYVYVSKPTLSAFQSTDFHATWFERKASEDHLFGILHIFVTSNDMKDKGSYEV